ncbi:hypothetical protein HPP92_016504 [Vanilla planifolia]|uniref:Uncharacterized protein n=1 Tax=Vanilla planifolia TaxID=51239 RepID=A0A835QCC8_VANPL|nr:hypothetical protein HPP92_016504 [Vanilla planifolia]
MASREHPSAKAKRNPPQSADHGLADGSSTFAGGRPSLPPSKVQSYNSPMYHPQPPAKRLGAGEPVAATASTGSSLSLSVKSFCSPSPAALST